jgi:DeoR/GlpR family transcriptional regulator of sugar metabolism
VADASKLGQVSPAFICPAGEIQMLITGVSTPDEAVAPFEQMGMRILRV